MQSRRKGMSTQSLAAAAAAAAAAAKNWLRRSPRTTNGEQGGENEGDEDWSEDTVAKSAGMVD